MATSYKIICMNLGKNERCDNMNCMRCIMSDEMMKYDQMNDCENCLMSEMGYTKNITTNTLPPEYCSTIIGSKIGYSFSPKVRCVLQNYDRMRNTKIHRNSLLGTAICSTNSTLLSEVTQLNYYIGNSTSHPLLTVLRALGRRLAREWILWGHP